MKKEFDADRLDVTAFAQAGALLQACEPLGAFARLQAEAVAGDLPAEVPAEVHWRAQGDWRAAAGAGASAAVPWLHLQAEAAVPVVCQRCLQPMPAPVTVDRWFRFAADEDTAALEDEEAEEDVLAVSRSFDLRALVEDELLMEMPVAPRHAVCPQAVPMSAQDADFEAAQAERPNPFGALAQLKKKPSDAG